jgi:flagellar basal-body rod protein FlgG
MYAQQARLDALSNDIANVNTAGYKPLRQTFRDLMYDNQKGGIATDPGVQLGTGAEITDMGRGTAQGAFQQTGEALDIGLSGPGFFQVKNPDGSKVLTRSGRLQVDVQGRLSTAQGQLLEPPVVLPKDADASKISINPKGEVAYQGKKVGQITLLNVTAPDKLESVGDTSFAVTKESGAPTAAGTGTTVQQGVIEASSADIGDTMTEMIQTQRAYELASKAITTQDKIAEIAVAVKR